MASHETIHPKTQNGNFQNECTSRRKAVHNRFDIESPESLHDLLFKRLSLKLFIVAQGFQIYLDIELGNNSFIITDSAFFFLWSTGTPKTHEISKGKFIDAPVNLGKNVVQATIVKVGGIYRKSILKYSLLFKIGRNVCKEEGGVDEHGRTVQARK